MTDVKERDAEDVTWLEARESGAPALPPLEPKRTAAYDGIQALIADLPDRPAPPGWADVVMAALPDAGASVETANHVSASRANRRRSARDARGRQIAMVAALAAAAGLAIWWQHRPDDRPTDLRPATDTRNQISIRVSRAGGVRGDATAAVQAAIGDTLEIQVRDAATGELRVYRDDQELVIRCPGDVSCGGSPGPLTVTLKLSAPGRYRAVYFDIPASHPPSGVLANDLAACACDPQTTTPITVR